MGLPRKIIEIQVWIVLLCIHPFLPNNKLYQSEGTMPYFHIPVHCIMSNQEKLSPQMFVICLPLSLEKYAVYHYLWFPVLCKTMWKLLYPNCNWASIQNNFSILSWSLFPDTANWQYSLNFWGELWSFQLWRSSSSAPLKLASFTFYKDLLLVAIKYTHQCKFVILSQHHKCNATKTLTMPGFSTNPSNETLEETFPGITNHVFQQYFPESF